MTRRDSAVPVPLARNTARAFVSSSQVDGILSAFLELNSNPIPPSRAYNFHGGAIRQVERARLHITFDYAAVRAQI